MERDIRGTDAARRVDAFYRAAFQPGGQHVWTASDLNLTTAGDAVHFTGQCFETTLEAGPTASIYRLALPSGELHRVHEGRLFRASRDGRAAFVERAHDAEYLTVLDVNDEPIARIAICQRIEALAWDPTGRELLVLAADAGADVSGVEGGYALAGAAGEATWLPEIVSTDSVDSWRRLYRWRVGDQKIQPFTEPPLNVWEASWLGDDAVLVVASDHHGEGSWYDADVRVLDAVNGVERHRHTSADQLAVPTGSPTGARWAAIEAFCSDRGLVCGTVILSDVNGTRSLDLGDAEATDLRWRDDDRLVITALRGASTSVFEIDTASGELSELWRSASLTIAGWRPQAVPIGTDGALAVIEGYAQSPAIVKLAGGGAMTLADFAPTAALPITGTSRHIEWLGRDGLTIDGWLILPEGRRTNLPLLLDIHGGPVSSHRNRYAAMLRAGPVLVAEGYALLLPNPRGSSGRGQDFARLVKGDMGGEDTYDYLAGIDHLVAAGIVDASRVAVTGTSYGGFMTAWMVTQTDRFAAAIPISPIANWYSQHFASQIPWFDEIFLRGSVRDAFGQYHNLSPVFSAAGARTPTLVLAGGRDKNTPTGQAVELYGALAEAGVEAALAVYPQDGHSLRDHPAYLDSAARIVAWLDTHLASDGAKRSPNSRNRS